MIEEHADIAQIFIEQYNLAKGAHYKFECLIKSMFSVPKYKFPAFEIYQMAFTEGKRRHSLASDLMVLLRLQRRLIIEVVEPNTRAEDVKDIKWAQLVEAIIDPIERDALGEVVCSRNLLIDGRSFGRISIPNPKSYKKNRLERDKIPEDHRGFNKMLGIKDKQDNSYGELSRLGIPLAHWFEEVWLIHDDEKGSTRCPQIW